MTSIAIAAKSSLFELANAPVAPITRAQWRLALREIKLLYVQKQYKRCVARSSSILAGAREPNSVYKLYLHFYSAICYEAMGLYAHDYSSKKVPLLREALGCFAACLSVFPAEVEVETELEVKLECDQPVLQRVLVRRDSGVELALRGMGGIDLGMVNKGGEDSDDDIFGVGVSTAAGAPESPTSPSSPSSPTPYASTVGSRSRSRSISPADTIVTSITDIIDRTLECPDDDPFLVDSDSDCEDSIKIGHGIGSQDLHPIETLDEKDPAEDQGHTLVPSPLQVRKSKTARPLSLFLPSFVTEKSRASVLSLPSTQAQNTTPNTPRPLPPLPNARSRNGTKARHEDTDADGFLLNRTQTFRQRELPPLPSINKHIRTYNASLAFLHTQISRTITHIQSQIQDLTTLQQARAISRRSGSFQRSVSFWSFSPVKDKNKGRDSTSSRQLSSCPQDSGISSSSSKRERLADRIARLRAEGWQTVGLKNPERGWKGEEYYQEFCGMALDELYLG